MTDKVTYLRFSNGSQVASGGAIGWTNLSYIWDSDLGTAGYVNTTVGADTYTYRAIGTTPIYYSGDKFNSVGDISKVEIGWYSTCDINLGPTHIHGVYLNDTYASSITLGWNEAGTPVPATWRYIDITNATGKPDKWTAQYIKNNITTNSYVFYGYGCGLTPSGYFYIYMEMLKITWQQKATGFFNLF